ncbi:hypothetical protein ABENE_05935 [Asticcacaulis benevestitus DSM 16100 = ATCC BAA-896]|uniref:Uncharacterized protein n=1 Tax=Asticcacaulis benevestitus DSM 16100 = ATCC BAA-896 TaxID=1121022 RepID=V4PHL8_9CAUL|nr:hypothetical protein ABENE_05935 [Asticcacaulis benevestitus DSM 16100 = ATCC BAA-896]
MRLFVPGKYWERLLVGFSMFSIVPVTLVIATLSYAYYERPFLKMRKGWNPFRPTVKATAAD